MNRREKEVIQLQLEAEEDVLAELAKQYKAALNQINEKIRILQSDELTQSKVYQIQYQKALRGQVEAILDKLQGDEYSTIQQYLHDSYTNAYVGTMYDIHGQGIPVIVPIDQAAAVKAVLTDSQISKGLYNSLGVDTKKLKTAIRHEITRGIASGMMYGDIARNIANVSKAPLSRANTIVRTEGHRIQQQSAADAREAAKRRGADVVKQWDATLDGATRPTHRKLDGQIREVDEPFEADGKEAMYPGDFGDPAEDCNCRCVALTRARWALDEEELETLKARAEFFELDKTKDFDDFREKYLPTSEISRLQQEGGKASPPKEYDGVFDDFQELNLTDEESNALLSLWKESNSTGYEYSVVISNGIAGKPRTSNLSDHVKINLDGLDEGVTVLHSHTNATPPSVADFRLLLDPRVEKIGVIGYNRDAYMVYVGDGWTPTDKEFEGFISQLRQEVNMDIMEDPNFLTWTVEERNYVTIREQAYRIARHYEWTMEGGRLDE